MAEHQWYYAEENQQRGPVTLEALQGLVQDGRVGPRNLVWTEGMKDWQEAQTVAELRPPVPPSQETGRSAPVPPPPPSSASSPRPINYHTPIPRSPSTYKGIAIASFVVALVGLLLACVGVGFIFGIIALVLSIVAMSGMKRGGNPDGQGLAIAGMVIAIIDLLSTPVFCFGLRVG
jgi:hypothetical protein